MSPGGAVVALSVPKTYNTPESYPYISPVKLEAGQDNSPPQQCFEISLINCHSGCHDGNSELPKNGSLECCEEKDSTNDTFGRNPHLHEALAYRGTDSTFLHEMIQRL